MTKIISSQPFLEKNNEPKVPPFYSNIFNRKQLIFSYWQIFIFSESIFDFLASKRTDEKEVTRWITKEIKSLMDHIFHEKNIDPRRFATQYRRGMKNDAIDKTEKMPDSLYYILKGMINYSKFTLTNKKAKSLKKDPSKKISAEFNRSVEYVLHPETAKRTPVMNSCVIDVHAQEELSRLKECYLTKLEDWPNLFFPYEHEALSGKRDLIFKELRKFKADIKAILEKCFMNPFPNIRTYQAFIFSADILFELLRYPCPKYRENEFAIFSLLTFKSIFNLCNALPFEYPIVKVVADKFKVLQKCAREQRDITDGAFLDKLISFIDSELKKPSETSFNDPEKFKVSDKYIETLTQDFSHDKLHAIARYLSDACGDDCNGLIYWLIKQVSVGLIISEQTEDKDLLASLLAQEQKSADSNLPQILYLIAYGLNSYSSAYDHKKTLLANEEKRKKSRSIKE